MRTTLTLDDDVVAEVERLRREEGLGLSEAVNRLARLGMTHRIPDEALVLPSWPMGAKVDVANIGEVLAMLDEDEGRMRTW